MGEGGREGEGEEKGVFIVIVIVVVVTRDVAGTGSVVVMAVARKIRLDVCMAERKKEDKERRNCRRSKFCNSVGGGVQK